MKIPTAGLPADSTRLREQLVTARDVLIEVTASLDGSVEAAEAEWGPSVRRRVLYGLGASACDALMYVRRTLEGLAVLEESDQPTTRPGQ